MSGRCLLNLVYLPIDSTKVCWRTDQYSWRIAEPELCMEASSIKVLALNQIGTIFIQKVKVVRLTQYTNSQISVD